MNKPDLTIPTRQSAKGLVLIFIFSLRQFFTMFWPVILVVVFQEKYSKNLLFVGIVVIVILVLLVVHTVLYYLNFIFYISNGEFVLKKGYFRKKIITIPLDRIQSVNTKQNLIQQVLNVVTLEIDTAGSVAKELKIQALEKSFSIELQHQLRSGEINREEIDSDNQGEVNEVVEELILKLSPADLMRIGISQNHLRAGLIIIVFGVQIFQQIQDLFKEKAEEYSNEFIGFISNSNWALITFLIVFFTFISIFFSLFRTVLKYFDFKLIRKEGTYRIESGLLNKRIVVIPHSKVQEINWETGPVKQLFGIYHLVFKQAVSGQNKRQQLVDAPGCLNNHLELLRKDLFGEDQLSDALKIYSNPFYFRPLWMIYGWLPVLLASPFLYGEWIFWLGVLVWLATSAFYCFLILKKRYFSMNSEQIVVSKGAISHQWTQMELHKIQAVEFRQTFFQKKRALSSLHIMNASGSITIPYINELMAKQIYNYLLFHTEVSKKKWM
ncbi:MAG: PH domain-containing protein [Draconibacterium sp.]|nr:PH domain-containing protein [Draconibacterium sp.]